ncbi:MAG: hypothetical protein KAX38_08590 [Candidatus Krumholzibacteria bacterium]|nr:hypothetical protein [Candidatus Krumholzibacteria bacterium]
MDRLEKFIREIRQQLFPYHHEHDIVRGGKRWKVGKGDYLSSWIAEQFRYCKKKNRCARRGMCAHYRYSDLARKNYDICNEVMLRIENGEIICRYNEETEKESGQNE